MYGLLDRDIKFILEAVSKHPEIDEELKRHIDKEGKSIYCRNNQK